VWEEVKYDETLESNEDKLWACNVLARGYKIRCCAEAVWLNIRRYARKEEWRRMSRQHLALYRITGQPPLTIASFMWLTFRAVASAPLVAFRHVRDTVGWYTHLVRIPWQARRLPQTGSFPEFDQKC